VVGPDSEVRVALTLWCVAGAVLCWPVATVRLPGPTRRPAGNAAPDPRVRGVLLGGAVAAAVALAWPHAVTQALAAGVLAGMSAWWDARRRAARPPRVRGEVAVVCDLWAACLDAGMPTGGALSAALEVSGARGSPGRDATVRRLFHVAGLLRVGADVVRAWQPVEGDPWLEPIGAAARRSHQAGADLATTVREQGRAVRRAEAAADERQAQRAGVLMTAPLTLCFLPAFICLGLAPVVLALVGSLELGR
jgi:hypothetical protein